MSITHNTDIFLLAAKSGCLDTVKKNATSNIRDKSGKTVLILATINGHFEIVKWLIKDGGANIEDSDKYGSTALIWAVVKGKIEIAKWLLREGGAKIKTALFCAICNGDFELVKWLTNEGANINDVNKIGTSSLVLACEERCEHTGDDRKWWNCPYLGCT